MSAPRYRTATAPLTVSPPPSLPPSFGGGPGREADRAGQVGPRHLARAHDSERAHDPKYLGGLCGLPLSQPVAAAPKKGWDTEKKGLA